MKKTTLGLAFLALLGGLAQGGENWPQWRGPALNGTSDSTDLPIKWSETEGVRWKVKLPSWSGSTPAIWGDRIFVASASEAGAGAEAKVAKKMGGDRKKEGVDLLLECRSKKDGSLHWEYKLPGLNYQIGKQNMSSPSPITDGKMVFWSTGVGVVTGLTVEGKQVWQVDLQKTYGKFGLNWGYGASPLLFEDKLIVPVLHGMTTKDPSYLVAFEPGTGKVLWRVERPTDAQNEGPDAYTTPMVMKYPDRTEIIVEGGDYFTGHDPRTGQEIWRCGGLNPHQDKFYRAVCSPAVVGDMVFACIKNGPFVACRGGGKGLVTSTHVAWTVGTAGLICDVPTPVSDGDRLYVLNDKGFMNCYEPKSGKVIYEKQRLPGGTYDASPLLADGKIYVTNEKARTTVLAAGPEFKILSENMLDDDYTLSSIAVSGKELFIRTSSHLYCIGK
jgi:outer membrane protein assembly factor BamB